MCADICPPLPLTAKLTLQGRFAEARTSMHRPAFATSTSLAHSTRKPHSTLQYQSVHQQALHSPSLAPAACPSCLLIPAAQQRAGGTLFRLPTARPAHHPLPPSSLHQYQPPSTQYLLPALHPQPAVDACMFAHLKPLADSLSLLTAALVEQTNRSSLALDSLAVANRGSPRALDHEQTSHSWRRSSACASRSSIQQGFVHSPYAPRTRKGSWQRRPVASGLPDAMLKRLHALAPEAGARLLCTEIAGSADDVCKSAKGTGLPMAAQPPSVSTRRTVRTNSRVWSSNVAAWKLPLGSHNL